MKEILNTHRRAIYGLLFALVMTLAAIGMARTTALADLALDEHVYLPLIQRGTGGSTIPLQ